jgi:hypothetical protein
MYILFYFSYKLNLIQIHFLSENRFYTKAFVHVYDNQLKFKSTAAQRINSKKFSSTGLLHCTLLVLIDLCPV